MLISEGKGNNMGQPQDEAQVCHRAGPEESAKQTCYLLKPWTRAIDLAGRLDNLKEEDNSPRPV